MNFNEANSIVRQALQWTLQGHKGRVQAKIGWKERDLEREVWVSGCLLELLFDSQYSTSHFLVAVPIPALNATHFQSHSHQIL